MLNAATLLCFVFRRLNVSATSPLVAYLYAFDPFIEVLSQKYILICLFLLQFYYVPFNQYSICLPTWATISMRVYRTTLAVNMIRMLLYTLSDLVSYSANKQKTRGESCAHMTPICGVEIKRHSSFCRR